MANYVTISTIGVLYVKADDDMPFADVWETMKQHLAGQIDQVLPTMSWFI